MGWRNLLFTTPGINQYISGAILYEETLFQDDPSGKPFVDVLKANNIIPGIKVDMGLRPLVGAGPGENWCTGLDGLLERCEKYYAQGARFAKWRTALKVDVANNCPTDLAIEVAAQDLARYARICQEAGLVPIVEPEIMIDGVHDIQTSVKVQEQVLTTVYKKIQENGVMLEGSLLKPDRDQPVHLRRDPLRGDAPVVLHQDLEGRGGQRRRGAEAAPRAGPGQRRGLQGRVRPGLAAVRRGVALREELRLLGAGAIALPLVYLPWC